MSSLSDNGMVHVHSPYAVPETLKRLESILKAKNLTVFARIDHSGEAAKVGLSMPPTKLLIFGNPKAGTPLMNRYSSIAIDLPLKALVQESADGTVWLSYNSPEFLRQRHGLETLPFAAIGNLLHAAAQ